MRAKGEEKQENANNGKQNKELESQEEGYYMASQNSLKSCFFLNS